MKKGCLRRQENRKDNTLNSKIKLLDCTLRDGGYINDWKFGYFTIKDIIKKLVESQVDYVEVGFLRDCEYDRNNAVFNNCGGIASIIPENRGRTMFTAMALHNKYDIEKLEDYDGKTIDALRITFHDYDIEEGLAYIEKVQKKGYKVFCNPINIMGYTDAMILELIQKVNRLQPYAFSIVDTFGSMMKEDLVRIYSLVEHNLDKKIVIGLHLHENLALSFSLAQEFLAIKATDRECVIDASMLGMGRAPGNLCMELIMDYMNKKMQGCYNVNPVLDGIDDHIEQLKQIEPWGYNTAYALSAKYNLHRNYGEFLLEKGRLRAKQINQILASIEPGKKTTYDENYIERLYQEYQNHEVDDSVLLERLKEELAGKVILILAPGASIIHEENKIRDYITQYSPVIFSANFAPENYKADYVFCSNAMRYDALGQKAKAGNVLVTSNLTDVCDEKEMLNYSELCFDEKGNFDNCVIMLLKLLIRLGIRKVAVAGFDGYEGDGKDYVFSYMTSQHTKGLEENVRIRRYVDDLQRQIAISFLTKSVYEE